MRRLVLLVLAMALAGCGSIQVQSSPAPATTASKTAAQKPPKKHRPKPKPKPVPKVKHPWHPGQPQKGIAVYWQNYGDTPQSVRLKAATTFNYVVGLGANAVSISFPFFVNGLSGTRIYGKSVTPSPPLIRIVVKEAQKRRLRVTLRPLMDEKNLAAEKPGGWRGSIEPSNRGKWFASYEKFLSSYLKMAAQEHVATFSIATEFNSLSMDPRWIGLVAWAKKLYPYQLIYTANWDSVVGVLKKRLVIGIDAYFGTPLPDNASVAQVTAAWNRWLRSAPVNLRGLVVSEAGIAAESGAYLHPWFWGLSHRAINLKIQQRWFEAACQAFHQNHLAGLYYWRVNFGEKPKYDHWNNPDHGTFVARPAAKVIRQCYQ